MNLQRSMQVKSLTYLRLLMIHGDAPTLWGIPEYAGQIPPTPSFKKENLWLETVPSVSHGWYIFLPPDGGSSYLGTVSRHRSQSLIVRCSNYTFFVVAPTLFLFHQDLYFVKLCALILYILLIIYQCYKMNYIKY